MLTKYEVDLKPLIRLANRLSIDEKLELAIIDNYSYEVTSDKQMLKEFTNDMISKLYNKEDTYEYDEIRNFFNSGRYYDAIERFCGMLDYLVCKNISSYYDNIIFSKYVNKEDGNLLVEFKIINYE